MKNSKRSPVASNPATSLTSLQLRAKAEQERRRRLTAKRGRSLTLAEFFQQSWHVLEPSTDLLWNWHLEAICYHAQEIFLDWLRHREDSTYQQRSRNLLVNVPPGSAKSRIISVCLPAWIWTRLASFKMIFLSSNPTVALRDSVLCRDLIESDWYRETFAPDWRLRGDQNSKSSYWNTAGGFRNAAGFNSRITGARADGLFWDDPHDAGQVESEALRLNVTERWDSAIRNRVNDPRSSIRVGIMQRLHAEDLSGHVLQTREWDLLCIPQEFEEAQPPTAIGWVDPRTEPGELMFPDRFSEEFVKQERLLLGSYGYAGQHQQRPSPAAGGMFQRGWWQFYKVAPAQFDRVIQSWDCTFKDAKTSDFVVGQVWGKSGSEYYLLDQVRDRMDINATLTAIRSLSAKWPQAKAKLVEDKANGSAVIDLLKREISGLIPINPQGGKVVRATAIAPYIEAGNVYLPDPSIAPWVHDLVEEFSSFPNGANDDQVDGASQAIAWLENNTAAPARRYTVTSARNW